MIRFHYGLVAFAVAAGLGIASSEPFRSRGHAGRRPRRRTKQQRTRSSSPTITREATGTRARTTGTRTGGRTTIGKRTTKIGARTTTTRTGTRTGTRIGRSTGPITTIIGTRTGTTTPMSAIGIAGPITASSSAASCSARSWRRPASASCHTRPSPISAGTGPTRICIAAIGTIATKRASDLRRQASGAGLRPAPLFFVCAWRLLGRPRRPAANAREEVALQKIIGRAAHDRERDEFRHERCRAQQARQPSFRAGIEIGHHHHGNERPSGIGPDQNAECRARSASRSVRQ